MRKLAQFVAAKLYPKAWRERYGTEFDCLLDDVNPSWWDVFNVFKGGLEMRVKSSRVVWIATVFGLLGALAGALATFAMPPRFASTVVIQIEMLDGTAAPIAVNELAKIALSRQALKQIIEDYGLYKDDRAKRPIEDVVASMQRDIRIAPALGTAFQISFAYPDRYKAQQVTAKLVSGFMRANVELMRHFHDSMKVITPANLPQRPLTPNRIAMIGFGLGAGLLLGLAVSLLRRRTKQLSA